MVSEEHSIPARVARWACERARTRSLLWLEDGENEARELNFQQLHETVLRVAHNLTQITSFGDRVVLAFPPGLEFVIAFLACLYSGRIAVPVVAPRQNRYRDKFEMVLTDCTPSLVLTTPQQLGCFDGWFGSDHPLAVRLVTLESLEKQAVNQELPLPKFEPPRLQTVAMLQYTSGSTGSAKGVTITHGNLAANQLSIQAGFEHGDETIFVGWLPLFHDMGLIGNVLQPLFLGIPSVLMSPGDFLMKPVVWLRAISKYRATTSGAPNFAYDLCVQRVTESQMQGVSLDSWSVAYNGAEPVRAATLQRFADRFARYGFDAGAFYPCFGLAECTLLATGSRRGMPHTETLSQSNLERGQATVPLAGQPTVQVVSCGRPFAGQTVRIVPPGSKEAAREGAVGEIWLAGPSVAAGYWQRPELTQETFEATLNGDPRPYFRTGDMGFLLNGDLYISGRAKDLIIIRGKNHHAHDLERTAEEAEPRIEKGRSAAFSVDVEDEERFVLVAEVALDHRHLTDTAPLIQAVRQAILEQHGIAPHQIVIAAPRTTLLTSSGKVQRSAMKQRFLVGEVRALGSRADRPHLSQ